MRKKKEKVEIVVDFPKRNEVVGSPHYAIRIKTTASGDVEVSIDGCSWQRCRQAVGYWWFDWQSGDAGVHTVTARTPLADGKELRTRARRFRVGEVRKTAKNRKLVAVAGLLLAASLAGSTGFAQQAPLPRGTQDSGPTADHSHGDHAGMEADEMETPDVMHGELSEGMAHPGHEGHGSPHERKGGGQLHGELEGAGTHGGHHGSMHGDEAGRTKGPGQPPVTSKKARNLMRKLRDLDRKLADRDLSDKERAKLERQRSRMARKLAREEGKARRRQGMEMRHGDDGHMMRDGEHMMRMDDDDMHQGMDSGHMRERRMHDRGQERGKGSGCGH